MILKYFETSEVLSRRLNMWAEVLFRYNFIIDHLDGKKNIANRPSRSPHYEIVYERQALRQMATSAITNIEQYNDLLLELTRAQHTDSLPADVKHRIVTPPVFNYHNLPRSNEQEGGFSNTWKVPTVAHTYEGRIYVPMDDLVCHIVISHFYHKTESGPFEAL